MRAGVTGTTKWVDEEADYVRGDKPRTRPGRALRAFPHPCVREGLPFSLAVPRGQAGCTWGGYQADSSMAG